MMKKILLLIILIISIVQIKSLFGCHDFKETFHFSKYSVFLEVDNLVHNDTGLPFVLIRSYHNKISQSAVSIFGSYLRFWDVKFLLNLILPVGIFGLIWAHLSGLKIRIIQLITIFSLILPLIEIIFKPTIYFPAKIIMFSLLLLVISLFGISTFLKEKSGKLSYLIVVVVLLFSVWWQLTLPTEFLNFCQ